MESGWEPTYWRVEPGFRLEILQHVLGSHLRGHEESAAPGSGCSSARFGSVGPAVEEAEAAGSDRVSPSEAAGWKRSVAPGLARSSSIIIIIIIQDTPNCPRPHARHVPDRACSDMEILTQFVQNHRTPIAPSARNKSTGASWWPLTSFHEVTESSAAQSLHHQDEESSFLLLNLRSVMYGIHLLSKLIKEACLTCPGKLTPPSLTWSTASSSHSFNLCGFSLSSSLPQPKAKISQMLAKNNTSLAKTVARN